MEQKECPGVVSRERQREGKYQSLTNTIIYFYFEDYSAYWIDLFVSTGLNGCKILLDLLRCICCQSSTIDPVETSLTRNILHLLTCGIKDRFEMTNMCVFIGLFEISTSLIERFGRVSIEIIALILDLVISALILISSDKFLVTEELSRKIGRFLFFRSKSFSHPFFRLICTLSNFVPYCSDAQSVSSNTNLFNLQTFSEMKEVRTKSLNLIILSLDIFRLESNRYISKEILIDSTVVQWIQEVIVNFEHFYSFGSLLFQSLLIYGRLLKIIEKISPSCLVSLIGSS